MPTYRGSYTHEDEDWNIDTNCHGLTNDLFITNVVIGIKNSGPRAGNEEFIQTKTREIEELFKWQVLKVVKKNAVSDVANIWAGGLFCSWRISEHHKR